MPQVAFAGPFSATLEPSVRARLQLPCKVIVGDEVSILPRLSDVDVLVTVAFNREIAAAAKPGAARNHGSAPSGTAVRGSSLCQDSSLS
jgi:hypothetical protein